MSMIYLAIPEENVLEKHIEGIQRFCGSNAKSTALLHSGCWRHAIMCLNDGIRCAHFLFFDSRQHALPATWIITRRSAKPDVAKWMKALPGRASSFTAFGGGVDNTSSASEELIHDFVDQTAFIQYFKASWVPKIEMWLSTMRALPLASQEASYRFADESDSFQNVKEKYIESTSWSRALQIPDSFTVDDKDHLFAKISSQKDSNLEQIASRLSRLR
ncbi:hypothetical protein NC652_013129 [Populus alba x Populus x berolinensis]|nr:hypothetical protein NC652_013129 [Populus alba x Populus x berolinensis]